LFLMLAFGSLAYFEGQFVGKTEMAVLGGLLLFGYKLVRR